MSRFIYCLLSMIPLLAPGGGALALERQYLASMDESSWVLTDSSSIMCRMEHQIPRFGKVVFTQEAGRSLQLELVSSHRFEKGINVELRSETTSWNDRQTRAVLARFEIPRYFHFAREPLPRTASGKILKRALREEAAARLTG